MVLKTRTKCMRRISLIVCVHALILSHDPSHQNSGSGPTLCWLGPAKTASLLLVLVAAANERAAEPLSIQLRVRPITSSVRPSRGHRGTQEMEWIQRNYTHKINVCCRDEGVKRKFLNWIGFDNDEIGCESGNSKSKKFHKFHSLLRFHIR